MTWVKYLVAKAPTGGIGKEPTKSFHVGKELVFDTDHPGGHQLQITSLPEIRSHFLLPYVAPFL